MFNFQGTFSAAPLGDSLFSLAHRSSFVNTFFQILLNFFGVSFSNQRRSPQCLDNITPLFANVNTFFNIFLLFFLLFQPFRVFLAYLVFYAFSGYYMLVLFAFYLLSSIYGMFIYFLLSFYFLLILSVFLSLCPLVTPFIGRSRTPVPTRLIWSYKQIRQ